MSEQAGERTEAPSEKRLREAREKGQVPRSRDLGAAAVMGSSAGALLLFGPALAASAQDWLRASILRAGDTGLGAGLELPAAFGTSALDGFTLAAPLLLVACVAAIAAPMALGGWNFSAQALLPDFSRLDPAAGIARMFSLQSLAELGKSIAKFAVVAATACVALWTSRGALLHLGTEAAGAGIAHGVAAAAQVFLWLALSLVLIAAVDVPLQQWNYLRNLRMTREELRRESLESEGRPEVRQRIRALQQEAARHRMMEAVPKADVIVTNPTHYAVALQYSAKKMRAPRVVAKGADLVAARIRELGAAHRVPILSAPPLARALYRSTGIGDEIPVALYTAVAQVLTWVHQLRRHRTGPLPATPRIELPDDGGIR